MEKAFIRISLAVPFLITALALGGVVASRSLDAATGFETFSGSYDWANGGSDELVAEFAPDGEGRWKVTFRFRFSGKSNTWNGSASGSLENGSELSGTANWKRRQWTWTAAIVDDVMRGQHTEILRNDEKLETGTFEVSR